MIKNKVKEEVIEIQQLTKERNFYMDESDQLTLSQFLLSRPNKPDFSPMIEKSQAMEDKKNLVRIRKETLGATHKSKKVVSDDPGKSISHKRKRVSVHHWCDGCEVKSPVMERAEEVRAHLAARFPSFVKSMLPSHVSRGFWMHLPKQFCDMYMPRHDAAVTLLDESGEEYRTNFIADKSGLSAGWKAFSMAHNLLEGDALVFHLIMPFTFKVYIVRSKGLDEVDGALGLLNLDAHRMSFGAAENGSKKSVSESSKCIRFSEFVLDSKRKKENGSMNFTILVNGLSIDSELSEYHRSRFYELCCSQKSFLHDNLLKNINSKLAAEIISETVNIADAIRDCKVSNSRDDYTNWEKTLEGFEMLGMNVGFLRAQLNRLVNLAFNSEEAVESKRYREARHEMACIEEEMRTLELKLVELKDVRERLDAEMKTLKVNFRRHELIVQGDINASW